MYVHIYILAATSDSTVVCLLWQLGPFPASLCPLTTLRPCPLSYCDGKAQELLRQSHLQQGIQTPLQHSNSP